MRRWKMELLKAFGVIRTQFKHYVSHWVKDNLLYVMLAQTTVCDEDIPTNTKFHHVFSVKNIGICMVFKPLIKLKIKKKRGLLSYGR